MVEIRIKLDKATVEVVGAELLESVVAADGPPSSPGASHLPAAPATPPVAPVHAGPVVQAFSEPARWPDAGVYKGISHERYLGVEGIHHTLLKNFFVRSPAYALCVREEDPPPTALMSGGALTDAMVFADEGQLHRFVRRDWAITTKEGRQRRDALEEAGMIVVAEDQWAASEAQANAIRRHEWWRALEHLQTQVSVVVVRGGIMCRGKPDILAVRDGRRILADLKVTSFMPFHLYRRRAWGLWHPQQLAWYQILLADCGVEVDECWVLAVHPKSPHEVIPYRMSERMMECARAEVLGVEVGVREAWQSGRWPGGPSEAIVEPPAYAVGGVDWSDVPVEE